MLARFFSRKREPIVHPKVFAGRPSVTRNDLIITDGPLAQLATGREFRYTGANRAEYYRFLRDRIPIVSAGIWTWVHLCTTPQRLDFRGPEMEVRRANSLADQLQRRVYPKRDGHTRGLERLVESFFLDLFTLGRVALLAHPFPDGTGISHVEALDPFQIRWRKHPDGRSEPFYELEDGSLKSLPPLMFFHRTLISDLHQIEGIDPLASIPFVVEIEQKMLEDMARSSHNAGTPRLQIKLAPPERIPGEDQESYTQRINSYFDATVRQFQDLGPDDNVFTWSGVEVKLIGGTGDEAGIWKLNREQVIEDVITGLKLFPWTLGRSHGTTKNWIYSQYNLLMQIVDALQQLGSDLAEWLLRLELRLAGNLAIPTWKFAPNQDPFIVERNRARMLEMERAERLIAAGILSRDQAARELGYDKAFRPE
ncbi:MAG: hypothetical protein V2A56_01640 [bacterium]